MSKNPLSSATSWPTPVTLWQALPVGVVRYSASVTLPNFDRFHRWVYLRPTQIGELLGSDPTDSNRDSKPVWACSGTMVLQGKERVLKAPQRTVCCKKHFMVQVLKNPRLLQAELKKCISHCIVWWGNCHSYQPSPSYPALSKDTPRRSDIRWCSLMREGFPSDFTGVFLSAFEKSSDSCCNFLRSSSWPDTKS